MSKGILTPNTNTIKVALAQASFTLNRFQKFIKEYFYSFMLVLSTISVLQILMQSTIITDNIRLHESDEVVHGLGHTLLHPGHCQVSAIEKAMDARKSVLIKICLKNGDMINVSIFHPSSDRL